MLACLKKWLAQSTCFPLVTIIQSFLFLICELLSRVIGIGLIVVDQLSLESQMHSGCLHSLWSKSVNLWVVVFLGLLWYKTRLTFPLTLILHLLRGNVPQLKFSGIWYFYLIKSIFLWQTHHRHNSLILLLCSIVLLFFHIFIKDVHCGF